MSSGETIRAVAIFWRSAGLGVQRPRMIAATRVSSSPVRRESSAAEIFCCSQRSATLAIILKILLQSVAVIADVSRFHAVSPTDVIDRHAERRRDLLPLGGAGGPAADHDGFDPLGGQPGALGNVLNGQFCLLEQNVDRFHPAPATRFVTRFYEVVWL